jgi:lysophospholipase L1-like esterase
LALVVTAETAIRVYHSVRWNISFIDGGPAAEAGAGLSPITLDAQLGWRATENYRFEDQKFSSAGTPYPVKISQDGRGFRSFGDLKSGKPRVLVIGDSFTQAVDASDDKTYYAVLSQLLKFEVFAYGGGGYGSLQEFMIVDKYFDHVKPDLIIWQYSTNDFINNSAELERASTINNNGMQRPYLTDRGIVYVVPKADDSLRLFALHYCRVCYMILNRLDRLRASSSETVEKNTASDGDSHQIFLKSVRTTDEIMGAVRRRSGRTPIAAFIVGTGPPYGPEYEQALVDISHHHGVILLDGIEAAVLHAENKGVDVRAADGAHWNETGHTIAGNAIAESLKKRCLFSLCDMDELTQTHF